MGNREFPLCSLPFTFDGTLTVSPQKCLGLSFYLKFVIALEILSFSSSLLVFKQSVSLLNSHHQMFYSF